MKCEDVFRDTSNWYAGQSKYASKSLIDFASRHAGKTILDIGCATGDYMKRLGAQGFKCSGVDINSEYINKAKEKGLDVQVMDAKHLRFPDSSFDTVLLFEVLEHVDGPIEVIKEAKRVAKKNVLLTVPNCTQFHKLKRAGLTFEHMLETDHINFFTKSDLDKILFQEFTRFSVKECEPIFLGNIWYPYFVRYSLTILYKLNVLSPDFYYRLYAVAEVI